MSQSLDVITALVAEGIRKQMAANKQRYIVPRDRREIAEDAAAVAIAVLVDVTGGYDHIVRAEGDTFTLQHPLAERLTGDLFDCEIHQHIAAGEPLESGRYKVVPADSQTFDLIPVKDQP
ncbi:DUF6085 family protein [Microbacterium sp. K24]|uniref:DUF6085 family protein n=1 Tax=Microbacterium sp. K24 TaxID=2305446 RepID=UPI00109C289E|nr:DUF6085 family protein [Microbacterium sp. K24]